MEQLRYIFVVIALFVCSASLAQKYFGLSGGLVSNVLGGSEVDLRKSIYGIQMKARTGPTFSVFVKKEVTSTFYLKYEAAYARRGNQSDTAIWNLNIEYVSVPLKLGYQPVNFSNSKHVQFGLEGGTSFNYVLGNGTKDLANSYSSANNAEVKKWSVSILCVANFEYKLPSRRILFFNGTWYHDVVPLISYNNGNATYKASNKGLMFTAGILVPMH